MFSARKCRITRSELPRTCVENARSGGTSLVIGSCGASQNFLSDINIGKSVVAQRRGNSSHRPVDCNSEDELGRPVTAEGSGAHARCIDHKTTLPATAHIADSQAIRTQTIAHSTETAECTLNTSMSNVLFHTYINLTR
jgi:hypothetical protein